MDDNRTCCVLLLFVALCIVLLIAIGCGYFAGSNSIGGQIDPLYTRGLAVPEVPLAHAGWQNVIRASI